MYLTYFVRELPNVYDIYVFRRADLDGFVSPNEKRSHLVRHIHLF